MKNYLVVVSLILALFVGAIFAIGASNPLVPTPVRIDIGNVAEAIPAGYQSVAVHPKTEDKAEALWLRSFGSMESYTFEKAATISVVVNENAVPCWCQSPEMPYKYVASSDDTQGDIVSHGTCEDLCPKSASCSIN